MRKKLQEKKKFEKEVEEYYALEKEEYRKKQEKLK